VDPLVDPDEPLGRALRGAIDDIAAALPAAAVGLDAGLAGGLTGLALFDAYLRRERRDAGADADADADAGRAADWLSEAVDAVAAAPQPPGLFGGYTGVAWAVQHLRADLGIADGEDPVSEIDEALVAATGQPGWSGAADVTHGLVGLGVHACERLDAPLGRALLANVVHRLDELAAARDGGTTWLTPPEVLPAWQRALHPRGYYNLGLAHGVPGILALLATAGAHGVAADRARPLVEGGLRWLAAHRLPPDRGALFERVVPAEDGAAAPPRPSRIAWCYGDLGAAVALLHVARSVGDDAWQAEAVTAARRAATTSLERSGCVDAGLCHGAAGNAHLFHRLYRATGDAAFREAARTWLSRAMAMRRPDAGVAGFSAWLPVGGGASEDGQWIGDPGFLTGAAGIGLVLLAAVGTTAPDWDRALLASARLP
jgi:hypothetical protein